MERCNVGVVGTGVMATGTAALLIGNGYPTVMYGRGDESCRRGWNTVVEILEDLVAHGCMSEGQKAKALSLLTVASDYAALADCGFVIESAAETLETKQEVMAKLEEVCAPSAILTSTTSAISANEIAANMIHKERFMVAHSWNPPHLVPLVEIVMSEFTSQEALRAEKELLENLRRVPVVLKKDVAGFIGNRLQHALFREAEYMIGEGICTAEDIDKTVLYSIGQRYSSIGLMEYWDHVPTALQTNIQTYLFPHLCNADRVSRVLEKKAADGKDLYDWTSERNADYEQRKRTPFYHFATMTIEE